MDKITITRALAELKLLDARINKSINQANFVDIFQNRKNLAIGAGTTKEVFIVNAEASKKSINDLIERRKRIKSAILISNANVKVKIGDTEYAVIEAIERKNSISYEKSLLGKMSAQLIKIKTHVDQQKPQLEKSIEDMVSNNLGGDKKPTKEDYNAIADPFLKANELNILDPCGVEKLIKELDEKIDEFLSEVDFVLSESNSRTEIEV